MKISELLGKPLICLAASTVEGILKDVIFDEKLRKAKYFVLFDDKKEAEEKVVPVSALFSIGNDALVIKSTGVVMPRESLNVKNNNPASKTIFTTSGKVHGRVSDIVFDDKLNVMSLELDKKRTLTPEDIASFSDEMLIIFEEGKKIKILRTPPKPQGNDKKRIVSTQPVNYTVKDKDPEQPVHNSEMPVHNLSKAGDVLPPPKPDQPVYSFPKMGDVPPPPPKPAAENYNDKEHVPQRIIGNYGFLLGRKVMADIVNQRGDIIVKKDTLISPATVESARKYGRLVELTIHSLSVP